MKDAPNILFAESLTRWDVDVEIDGKWYAGRPMGYGCLCPLRRLRIAWKVFTGEYDALRWWKQ